MNLVWILFYLCLVIIQAYADKLEEVSSSEGDEDCGCGANLNRNSQLPAEAAVAPKIERSTGERRLTGRKDDMVLIQGGRGILGTDDPQLWRDGESPKRVVTLSSFYMDKYEVSNEGTD
jgi:formylglycine-generating enzyme required for sulfatase activity